MASWPGWKWIPSYMEKIKIIPGYSENPDLEKYLSDSAWKTDCIYNLDYLHPWWESNFGMIGVTREEKYITTSSKFVDVTTTHYSDGSYTTTGIARVSGRLKKWDISWAMSIDLYYHQRYGKDFDMSGLEKKKPTKTIEQWWNHVYVYDSSYYAQ